MRSRPDPLGHDAELVRTATPPTSAYDCGASAGAFFGDYLRPRHRWARPS